MSLPRIINGVCEYCGIKAVDCEHYSDPSKEQPMDEAEKLKTYGGAPVFKNISIEPLSENEKAKSVEDAVKAKEEYVNSLPQAEQLGDETGGVEPEPEVVPEVTPEV